MSYQSTIRNKKTNKSFNKAKETKYEINNDCEEYGYVVKLLGNCRCHILSNSHIDCIGTICGSLRKFNKRILIEKGDIVIITQPSPNNNKVVITYKLNKDQVDNLITDNILNSKLSNMYNNGYLVAIDKELEKLNDITFSEKQSEN